MNQRQWKLKKESEILTFGVYGVLVKIHHDRGDGKAVSNVYGKDLARKIWNDYIRRGYEAVR